MLLGEHDFSAFRAAECQAKSPVRTLHAIGIERDGERIEFRLRANAWLQHMVRNIVGTLVYVGKGKHPPQWAKKVLESRDRALAAPTFASEGLYLEAVEYEPRWELPAADSAKLPRCRSNRENPRSRSAASRAARTRRPPRRRAPMPSAWCSIRRARAS